MKQKMSSYSDSHLSSLLDDGELKPLLEAVESQPGNVDNYTSLIPLLRRKGLFQEALLVLESLFKNVSDDYASLAAAYYLRSSVLFKSLEYKAALTDISEAVALQSKNYKFLLLRAQIQSKIGLYEEAIGALDSVIAQQKNKEQWTLTKAIVLTDAGRHLDAQLLIDPYLQNSNTGGFASYVAAYLVVQEKDFILAQKFLLDAERAGFSFLRIAKLRLQIYLETQQNRKAIKTALQALSYDNADVEFLLLLGKAYMACNEHHKAIEPLNRSCHLFPYEFEPFLCLAQCYTDIGEPERADLLVNYILKLDSDHYESILMKSELLVKQGHELESLAWLKRACRLKDDRELLERCGKLAFQFKDYNLAIQMFTKLYMNFVDFSAVSSLAEVFILLGRYDEAQQYLHKLIKEKYDAAKSHRLLASIFYQRKQYDQALLNLNKSLYYDPKDVETVLAKVCLLREAGNHKETERFLDHHDKLLQKEPRYYFEKYLLVKKTSYENAYKYLKKAVSLDANNTVWHLAIAALEFQYDKKKQSLATVNHCIILDQTNATGYAFRAIVYNDQNCFSLALEDYNYALSLEISAHQESHFLLGRAIVYYEMKRYLEAEKDLLKARKLLPEDVTLSYYYICVLECLGRSQDALKHCNQLTEGVRFLSENLLGIMVKKAQILMNFGALKRAVNTINEAIDLDLQNAFCYYVRGCCYFRLKKFKYALRDFHKAFQLNPTFKKRKHDYKIQQFLAS